MFVVNLKGLNEVALDHFRLMTYALDGVIDAALDVDKGGAHCVNYVKMSKILLDNKVLIELGVGFGKCL